MYKRAWVIGNGPSLNDTNLDLLKNEITFATNRIHFAYDKTDWRPTYYVRAESMQDTGSPTRAWLKDMLIHLEDPDVEVWANLWFNKKIKEETGKSYEMNAIKACAHYTTSYNKRNCPHMWHLPNICSYGSSVHVAIQMAVKMGYGPIYLLGCDLGYGKGQDHFYPDENDIMYKKQSPVLANLNSLNAHLIASRSSTIPIYNCSVGGELEVYPRKYYYDVIAN